MQRLKKNLNLLLVIAFQAGYMEWAGGNHLFIFQAEAEIFSKARTDILTVLHPAILIPLAGLVLLIIAFFRPGENRILRLAGIISLGLFMLLISITGLLSLNYKMVLSTIPFWFLVILFFRAPAR